VSRDFELGTNVSYKRQSRTGLICFSGHQQRQWFGSVYYKTS